MYVHVYIILCTSTCCCTSVTSCFILPKADQMPLPLLLGTRSGLYQYDFRKHAMVAGSQTRVVSECDMRFIAIRSCSSAMLVVIRGYLKLAQCDIWCRVLLFVHTYVHTLYSGSAQLCTYNMYCTSQAIYSAPLLKSKLF